MLTRAKQFQLALLALFLGVGLALVWQLLDGSGLELARAAPPAVEPELPPRVERVALAPEDLVEREQTAAQSDAAAEPAAADLAAPAAKQPARVPGVRGRVTDVLGFPLAGARVTARVQRSTLTADVGTALTDDQGTYSIAFPSQRSEADFDRKLRAESGPKSVAVAGRFVRPGHLVRGGEFEFDRGARRLAFQRMLDAPLELALRAEFRGYEPRVDRRAIDQALPDFLEVDLELEPGLMVEGTVVYQTPFSDQPIGIPGAQVFLLDARGEVLKATGTFDDGTYWLAFAAAGTYQLFARRDGLGTAYLPELEIDPGVTHRMPPLFPRGDNQLSGLVVYPDKRTVEGLDLEARHELVASAGSGLSEAQRIALERDQGLVISAGRTGPDGKFTLRGLQQGNYQMHFAAEEEVALQPSGFFPTSNPDNQLVYSGYRLRVSVRQYDASPADPAQIAAWKLSLDAGAEPVERLKGMWSEAGDWFAIVKPSERYLVKAWASNQQCDWTVVEILPASYETYASLALFGNFDASEWKGEDKVDARFSGRLQIEVVNEKGRKLGGWRATMRSTDGLVPRGWSGAQPDAKGEFPPLPPGVYGLQIVPTEKDSLLVIAPEPRAVVIKAGETAREEIRTRSGGRLFVKTMANAALDDDDVEDANDPRERSARAWERPKGADVAQRKPLRFRADEKQGIGGGEWLELGRNALCENVLAAGSYVVTIEPWHGAERDFEIEIEPEKVAEIDFVARRDP